MSERDDPMNTRDGGACVDDQTTHCDGPCQLRIWMRDAVRIFQSPALFCDDCARQIPRDVPLDDYEQRVR